MGAGRKTQTFNLKEKSQAAWTVNCSAPARNLRKGDLCGVIFGCKHNTIKECYVKQLFGLPAPHFSYVRNIDPGLPLFLFNYSDRKLHGIFEAASHGQLNINPHGWTEDGSNYTPYAAQVKIQIRMQCQPLLEEQFSPLIAENYYEPRLFWFELDRAQTQKLMSMFQSSPVTARTSFPKSTEKWNTLFRVTPVPNARQEGDNIGTSTFGSQVANPDQANMEQGLFWDDDGMEKEIQMLETLIDDEEGGKYKHEATQIIPGFGRSYSSVVQNTGTSTAHSHQSDVECDAWDGPGSVGESGLFENTVYNEEAENHKLEVVRQYPDSDQPYSSFVSSNTFLPQKTWSSLFKAGNVSDAVKELGDFKAPALEVNLPHSDQNNMEWESSSFASCFDRNSQLLRPPAYEEDLGKYDEQHVSVDPNREVLYSSVVTRATFPQSTSYEMLPIADARQDGEVFKKVTSEANLHYLDKSNTEWSSSCVSPCLDGESQPSEAPTDEDETELLEERHVQCSSFSALKRKMISEGNHGKDIEVHLEDIHFSEAAVVPEMESSGLHSVVAKLLQVVEELKSFQSKQVWKINSLELELGESKTEIQRLKEWCKTLETVSWTAIRHVDEEDSEAEEFESVNEKPGLDESVLIVGGFDGSSWLSSLDLYSPSEDLMRSLSSMSVVRSYASAARLNGEIFVFGGVDGNLWYDTVESYNPQSNQWISRPSLNQRKGSLAGVSLNDKIFAIGGGNGIECFSEVEMFDVDVGRWIPIRSMVHKRFGAAAAEINGMLYVAGGYDGKDYLKSIERFDPREHSWTRLESMTSKRGCLSLAVLNEKLYAMGGFDGARMVPTVEVFDPLVGSWMPGESMNDSRGYSGAVVVGDAIYVIGGLTDNEEILDTVECYKEGHGWQITDLKAIGKRCFFSAMVQ